MPGPETEAGYAPMALDVKAARRYLASRTDVQQAHVGSRGRRWARTSRRWSLPRTDRSSASRCFHRRSTIAACASSRPSRQIGSRPVLLVAATDDRMPPDPPGSCRRRGGGPRELLMLGERAGHGTGMLSSDENLARALVDWFRRTLL